MNRRPTKHFDISMRSLHSIYSAFLRAAVSVAALAIAACSGDGPSDPGWLSRNYGSLVVTINGLPDGTSASVTVKGPGSFSRTLTSTTTLTQLGAGEYTVLAADVTDDGSTYSGAPDSESITVTAGATATTSSVNYVLATGALSITLSGLPQSASAVIVVSGPGGYTRTLNGATEIPGLKPGTYSVEAREVQTTNARYAATPGTQQVHVSASLTPSLASVLYAKSTGSLALAIIGLPAGADAAVNVRGPDNYFLAVTEETVIENLAPGTYAIAASHVLAGSLFTATPTYQEVTVAVSALTEANVTYASAGTSLSIQIQGLPGQVSGAVTVTGPNGYSKQLSGPTVLSGIPAGSYTVSAAPVSESCASWTPVPATQNVSVPAGQGTSVTVTYSSGSGSANLCIEGAYVTQSVQAFDGSVPLVAGRNGLLRVFVRASATNAARPTVRARFYDAGGALVNTTTIQSPGLAVPVTLDESSISQSWNTTLSGTFLQPGLRMLLDVDPNNAVSEPNESDNVFPANGTAVTLDIRTVSTMLVSVVPVIQSATGDVGRVDDTNLSDYILPMQQMFPVAGIDAEVRPPYTFTGAELQSGGGNWVTLLSEINALRVAEADGRMYYGVVRVGYNSGVAGVGYIGTPAAIGWDHEPSGHGVMAHELGHNFGRLHAPCGNPAGLDGSYPYGGASIGVFGFDITTSVVKTPSLHDLMSYCDPAWISDYTYKAILNFRANVYPALGTISQAKAAKQRGLLVWGRIEQGRLVLEPGIEVDAPATLPSRGGPHRVEGFGPSGETLFSLSFAGDRVADAGPNDQTFAFVVPMSQLRGVDLARIRLSALGRQVEQRGTGRGVIPSAQRTGSGKVRVSWNPAAAQVALVRDARSGRILSFARGGGVDLSTVSDDFEVTLSDGVKSVRSRIRPR
jgi:hypothetical protein